MSLTAPLHPYRAIPNTQDDMSELLRRIVARAASRVALVDGNLHRSSAVLLADNPTDRNRDTLG